MRLPRGLSLVCLALLQFTAFCSGVSTQEELDATFLGSSIKISPDAASVRVNETLQFSGTGGEPPYTYSVYFGSGSVSGDKYTAPAATGLAIVSITDRNQRRSLAKVTILPPLPPPVVDSPTLLSSTPADLATNVATCTGSPCVAKISLVFSKSMNTALAQTFTTEIWDSNSITYFAVPNSDSTFSWSTTTLSNDTLTISMSWLRFPEKTKIRYTLAPAGLQDTETNPITAQVQRSFATTTAPHNFAVSDNGQVKCYNDTADMTAGGGCGSDPLFPGQDGDYANTPNARSFTGPTAHATFTSDRTTTDNVTGLTWKSCSEGKSGSTCATGTALTISWYNALNQCSALNFANSGAGYAGLTQWRLPTVRELGTLPYIATSVVPSIDAARFPGTPWADYWSAGTNGGTGLSWAVSFLEGDTNGRNRNNLNYVRCVADSPIVSTTWTNNGDGTTTDNISNLRWQRASSTGTWKAALQNCDALTLGTGANQSNWRLPNLNELTSITDRSRISPTIDLTQFPDTASGAYWTNNTNVGNVTYAWIVSFDFGHSDGFWTPLIGGGGKKDSVNIQHFRCVSTGP